MSRGAARQLPSQPAAASCAHCGSPVASGAPSPAFCCAGCRSVFEIVHAAGLDGYYQYQERDAPRAVVTSAGERKYQELDDAAFRAHHVSATGGGEERAELLLEGIHCSACVWLIERVGRVVPGVTSARVDLSRNVVELCWNATQTSLGAVARGLGSLGYTAHPVGESRVKLARASDRELLLRLGVAGAAAGNVMLMALALYSGAFSGMEASFQTLFRWASLAIATPTVFWCGAIFLRGGWAALRTRSPHMDLPISIGILTGHAGGAFATLSGRGEIYFDSLCTLIFLLLVGRYLQQSHHRRSTTESELLLALAPQTARLVEGDTERDTPASAVPLGAMVHVMASERIPVDGIVVRGRASVDTSMLSGEPMPVDTLVADRVYAGTACRDGELWLRTEAVAGDTRLGRLMATVAATQQRRAPIVRLADQIAGYFVLAILAVAALTLGVWLHLEPSVAVDHTVALLVVTCPCALGMATPLAVSVALRRAAGAGILFKGGEMLEALARPGLIVFDKTGTLTLGQPELLAWLGDVKWQPSLRALEARSGHPLARCIQRAFPDNALPVDELRELPHGGVTARVDGRKLLAGSPTVVQAELGGLPAWSDKLVKAQTELGRTPVVLAVDGAVRAVLAFGDRVRPEAQSELKRLTKLGYRFRIASGDHQRVVDAVAAELGLPADAARGGMSPEAKLALVNELRAQGERVFMVGDGVNDAAAMAAATVGFAVHGGAETCLRAADVFATRAGLGPIVEAVTGSRRTLSAIRRGIVISLAYNLVGVLLAILGILSPLLAAIMMPLSSISVVSLALRAKSFERAPS